MTMEQYLAMPAERAQMEAAVLRSARQRLSEARQLLAHAHLCEERLVEVVALINCAEFAVAELAITLLAEGESH